MGAYPLWSGGDKKLKSQMKGIRPAQHQPVLLFLVNTVVHYVYFFFPHGIVMYLKDKISSNLLLRLDGDISISNEKTKMKN